MEIKPLKKEDRKYTIEVHQSEAILLELIRNKYQFGEITLETKNGLPFRIIERVRTDICWY